MVGKFILQSGLGLGLSELYFSRETAYIFICNRLD